MNIQPILQLVTQYGYLAIFALYTAGIFGFPIPDESLLVFIGFLVKKGTLNYLLAMTAAFLGVCVGITVSYVLGRTGGSFALKRFGKFLFLDEKKTKKAHDWFEKYGKWSLVLGFFLPGIRHLTAVFAGTTKMKYPHFAFFTYLGAFIWVNVFLILGGVIADVHEFAGQLYEHSALISALLACVLLTAFLFWYIRNIRRKQGGKGKKK